MELAEPSSFPAWWLRVCLGDLCLGLGLPFTYQLHDLGRHSDKSVASKINLHSKPNLYILNAIN